LKRELQQALVARTQDEAADLRARIAAGLALGWLGDPRFERRKGAYGDYLLPPMILIPSGTYTIGSDEGLYNDESPVHTVKLAAFSIGQFPVTNAEWALFMQAKGYEGEEWWETAMAQAWRRGDESSTAEVKQTWRQYREIVQADAESFYRRSDWTPADIEFWQGICGMSDAEFEEWLNREFLAVHQTQPAFWNDDAHNNPAQPVVGICWYEARAYCAWLSGQTGQLFRLPTEAEWEAAARGRASRRYAYGDDFDVSRGNTFETHIRRTTPIGVFPSGATPEGVVDLTGNTWDWTSSLYRDYPYDATDGREALDVEGLRGVRGGSWRYPRALARAAYRSRDPPAGRRYDLGLRLACSSPVL
jgi:formylglycine-generating enzyme required for sulfatase activity